MAINDKDRDDVMERLLELGGDKKYLTFDDLNRELPDSVVSPDDIEDVLQKLEGSNIAVADSDDGLTWSRRESLGLTAGPEPWESEMVEYPCVFDWNGRRYMLYNGNDYGRSGVGLAVLD